MKICRTARTASTLDWRILGVKVRMRKTVRRKRRNQMMMTMMVKI